MGQTTTQNEYRLLDKTEYSNDRIQAEKELAKMNPPKDHSGESSFVPTSTSKTPRYVSIYSKQTKLEEY